MKYEFTFMFRFTVHKCMQVDPWVFGYLALSPGLTPLYDFYDHIGKYLY